MAIPIFKISDRYSINVYVFSYLQFLSFGPKQWKCECEVWLVEKQADTKYLVAYIIH